MEAIYKHKETGAVKTVKVGFSWTTFFFGFIPALFRGDFIIAIIYAVVWGIARKVAPLILNEATIYILSVTVQVIWAAQYNSIHEKNLIKRGFKRVGRRW